MLAAFLVWTMAVLFIDVQAIGPQGATVGFATINRFVHNFIGIHMFLYTITDWLSLISLMFVMGFGALGFIQWVKRKNILRVDYDIIVLGGFYIVVLATYIFFETFVVNYRPVLINGCLEASYPSSTTMLVMCTTPTAAIQFNARIKHKTLNGCVFYAITAFMVFMLISRLVSGVHWFSDIIGGALISTGLVLMYDAIVKRDFFKKLILRTMGIYYIYHNVALATSISQTVAAVFFGVLHARQKRLTVK
jgi:undecaprenyl-diphosphatase